MSTEPAPTPTPAPKRLHSAQDQKIANRINTYKTDLTAAQANADFVALLTPRGYNAEGLAEGLNQCEAAQAAFNARQDAMGAQDQAARAVADADKAARAGYDDFRKIARKVFQDNDAAKTTLNLSGRVPQDQEKFLTHAAAVYNAALSRTSYLAALGKRGYDQAGVEAEQAKLDALTAASAAHENAQAAAERATAARNETVKALDVWWGEFRAVAQVALKDRPDLMGLLEL